MNRDGTHSNPKKIKAMNEFLVLTTVFNVCAFLGLTSSYRSYMKGCSCCIIIPSFEFTKKDTTFNYNIKYQKSLQ